MIIVYDENCQDIEIPQKGKSLSTKHNLEKKERVSNMNLK